MPAVKRHELIGLVLFVFGGVLLLKVFGIVSFGEPIDRSNFEAGASAGAALILFGLLAALGRLPSFIKTWFGEAQFSDHQELSSITQVEKADLGPEERAQKAAFASSLHLPTHGAPPFRILTERSISEMGFWPGADPNFPMYSLGKDYRIIDWNKAFSLAFDRSMEGLRGQFVTEWVYHLANYEDILRHGESAFADRNNLPRIDIEQIQFVSKRYNGISATKRAYQIPDDDGECVGWLIILDLRFDDDKAYSKFYSELIQIQRMDLLWSEYAIVYDKVLANTKVYEELIAEMVEGRNGERPIRPDTAILDLGAGTGIITEVLSEPDKNRAIVAIDDNRIMLNLLKWKCSDRLTEDLAAPGVTVIKQDILSLYGLDDNHFDYVVANNVLYSLGSKEAIQTCLEEVHRVLKPSGEIRLSGPKKDTDLNRLFRRLEEDLKNANKFKELKDDFKRVEEINKGRLSQFLFDYDLDDMKSLVQKAGFSQITYETNRAYGGEAMIIFATK